MDQHIGAAQRLERVLRRRVDIQVDDVSIRKMFCELGRVAGG